MKIAYCGYDFFSQCLQALLSQGDNVYRVFTFDCDNRFDFNKYITDICRENTIPFTAQAINQQDIEQLQADGCKLLITAGYRYKIPSLSGTDIKGINIHPTLLPTGRGPWPLSWTILTGQERSGVTIHKLTEEYDAGDILLQEDFAVGTDENLESLSAKTQILAKSMLPKVMNDFSNHWQNAKEQGNDYSYWPRPTNAERTLDWNNDVSQLDLLCRAFGKMGCYANFDGKFWLVYRLVAWPTRHDYEPGIVVHKTNTEMIVAASDGLVNLQYFEPATLSKPV